MLLKKDHLVLLQTTQINHSSCIAKRCQQVIKFEDCVYQLFSQEHQTTSIVDHTEIHYQFPAFIEKLVAVELK